MYFERILSRCNYVLIAIKSEPCGQLLVNRIKKNVFTLTDQVLNEQECKY